ncbi:rod shape-determining protein [Candidatus Shapirobacteria bacterium]|nr:rod shape-determining protein [Candidatus Shapirobacteria bacterium]
MIKILENFYWEIGVDLGSSNTLIILKDRGIVVDEPALIARIKKKRWSGLSAPKTKKSLVIAYGAKAKEIVSREPGQVEVISPIKNGVIVDLEAVEELVSYYLKLVYEVPSNYPKLFKPRVVVSVPSGITDVQKRAVRSVFYRSGARDVILVEGSVLAGLGIGVSVKKSSGVMILDVGGGKTEVSVVSLGGVVVGKASKIAGNEMDAGIANYIKMKYGLLIGQNTAERVKIEIGNVGESKVEKAALVRGRDMETGLPKSVKIGEGEIREAIAFEAQKIVKLVVEVLDQTPPELMEDILKRGIVMVGNGSKLRGLDRLIEKETKINTKLAEDPGWCVVKGIGELLGNKQILESIKIVSSLGK